MTGQATPATHVTVRALLAAVAAGALLLGAGWHTPAAAHASLLSSTPSDGERLEAAPEQVTLTFNESMSEPAYIVVTGPDGEQAAEGEVAVDGADVSVALVDGVGEGSYTVAFRVVSADGHPVTGQYAFGVGDGPISTPGADQGEGAAPETGENGSESTGSTESAPVEEERDGGSLRTVQWAVGIGLVAVAAVLYLLSRRRRSQ